MCKNFKHNICYRKHNMQMYTVGRECEWNGIPVITLSPEPVNNTSSYFYVFWIRHLRLEIEIRNLSLSSQHYETQTHNVLRLSERWAEEKRVLVLYVHVHCVLCTALLRLFISFHTDTDNPLTGILRVKPVSQGKEPCQVL